MTCSTSDLLVKTHKSPASRTARFGTWALMRTAFLLTGDRYAAEDLVQSTLERSYTAWRRVSGRQP
ncbi:hypothetical protein GCM10010308_63580 [Streptomyces vinaceusdrappus]|nr:hypothetical protein GCM10010301_63720 [Streptomyces plicatus]GHC36370.1 hypothetical protein GCM10010308_63580 [Streptomyces vinaceusdrappus]